jgi:hypothetical protein
MTNRSACLSVDSQETDINLDLQCLECLNVAVVS